MALKNPWIGYNERDYFTAKTSILNKLKYLLPEMTDHTESNPFVKLVSLWCGILEHLNYYIDRKAQEVYLVTLRRFKSALKIARGYDYRVKGTNPATVDLRFYLNAAATAVINIPTGSQINTKSGVPFYIVTGGSIAIGEFEITLPAIQRQFVPSATFGVSDGNVFQEFEIGQDVVDNSISIIVAGDNYTPIETISGAQATDMVFVGSLNENERMAVEFGDGINGFIPPAGQSITGSYYTSLGTEGNQPENTITEIISAITVPSGLVLRVQNLSRSAGGVDSENVNDLKKRVPKSIRTNERAITKQDFSDTAEMVNGVAKAADNYSCGTIIPMHIVPVGGGEASETLKLAVRNFFENRRPITFTIEVFSAGDVRIIFEILLRVLPNFNRQDTAQLVEDNIVDYMSEENQQIKGEVRIGNIYQVIENTPGVDYCEVQLMTVLPAAIAKGAAPVLNWDRSILSGSTTTSKWLLKITGVSTYVLFRNNNFVGNFDFDTEYNLTDLMINVHPGGYSVSDQWLFTTYNYNGSVTITDLSIPTTQANNITITATGGI